MATEQVINPIAEEQKRIVEKMEMMNPSTEEYLNAAKSLKTLSETKTEEKKSKIDKKVVIETALKILAGFGLIALSTTHILDDKVERMADRLTPKDRR